MKRLGMIGVSTIITSGSWLGVCESARCSGSKGIWRSRTARRSQADSYLYVSCSYIEPEYVLLIDSLKSQAKLVTRKRVTICTGPAVDFLVRTRGF